jgi:drug/metabolite transporter (DMT)-like permease
MIFWLFLMSGLFMVLGGLLFQWPFFEGSVAWNPSMIYLVLMGLFGTALGHSAYNFSLKGLRSYQASLLGLMSPATSLILGYFILKEQVTFLGLTGLLITLFGIAAILQSHFETRRWMFWRRQKSILPTEM